MPALRVIDCEPVEPALTGDEGAQNSDDSTEWSEQQVPEGDSGDEQSDSDTKLGQSPGRVNKPSPPKRTIRKRGKNECLDQTRKKVQQLQGRRDGTH